MENISVTADGYLIRKGSQLYFGDMPVTVIEVRALEEHYRIEVFNEAGLYDSAMGLLCGKELKYHFRNQVIT